MHRPWFTVLALAAAALLSWLAVGWPEAASHGVEAAQVVVEAPAVWEAAAPRLQLTAAPPQPSAAAPQAPSAVAAEPETSQPPQPSAAAPEPEVAPPEDQGPVAERRARFDHEPRDSAASEVESTLRAAFTHPDIPPALLESVLCRQTVCKVVARLSPERLPSYVFAVTRASLAFATELAVAPAPTVDANQVRQIELFFERKPAEPRAASN